ncbi:MAG: transposase, partial [Rubrivivax sp.]|nr:transposase [Rubrivivax sp.]
WVLGGEGKSAYLSSSVELLNFKNRLYIDFYSLPSFDAGSVRYWPWVVGAVGTALSALASIGIFLQTRARDKERLVLHNLRPHIVIGGRDWAGWWEAHGTQVPAELHAELERESARLALVKQQIKALEAARRQALQDGKQPLVAQLAQLRAIGPTGAWVLVKELFGWRRFANRRELAGCLGLAPTPYDSGGSQVEQGISKAGNKRARALLVELAWGWLRLQPDSELTQWFNRRFATGGKRMRRVGIVALARRLAIALWRYLQTGEIPAGATLKPVAA